jgi:hypothetical protein
MLAKNSLSLRKAKASPAPTTIRRTHTSFRNGATKYIPFSIREERVIPLTFRV